MTFIGVLITMALGTAKIFDKNIRFERYYWVYDVKAGPDY